MENKQPIKFLLFTLLAILAILITFVSFVVFGDSCEALSCGSIKGETVVANEEIIWTESHEVIRLLQEAEIHGTKDMTKTEKEIVVANVTHEVIKGPKYTIRVGLQGSRKPIPTITGATPQERAKEWLETTGLGYTLPTWIKLGEKYNIDYTLPICIAWADSHLGKALKSTNNIGNVGNNDRGQVVHYDSMDKGIEAIFRVLNNKYLGGNKQLGELSGEGRMRMSMTGCENAPAPKKCYATSKGVWSTNVSNCLSVLHNKEITESYFFRLQ